MAIHRVGPLPDAAPRQVTLGRVLVTIDDLAALVDIMRQQATDPDSVKVHFSGGYFTDPEDLRSLSDDEITTLKVHSDNAEVNLEPTRTIAIGDEPTRARILNTWARTRQTRSGIRQEVAWRIAGALLATITVGYILIPAIFIRSTGTPGAFDAFVIVLCIFVLWRTRREVKTARTTSSAVIEPMSLHEYRQLQNNNRYPRASWIVAIIAVIVAVVAIAATFVVPFVTPH